MTGDMPIAQYSMDELLDILDNEWLNFPMGTLKGLSAPLNRHVARHAEIVRSQGLDLT